jgi:hypothetical protein
MESQGFGLCVQNSSFMDSNFNLFHFLISLICIQLSFIVGSINISVLMKCYYIGKHVKVTFLPTFKYKANRVFCWAKEQFCPNSKFCKNFFKVQIRSVLKLIKGFCIQLC